MIRDFYRNIKAFVKNLPMFLKMAWTWRWWDSEYTIDVLVTLLQKQARGLRNGYCVDSETTYRRCMTAAGKLDRAYNRDIDKVICYLLHKNPPACVARWVKKNELSDKQKEICNKMYKVAQKRDAKNEAKAKAEAWAYLAKYVEHFWD